MGRSRDKRKGVSTSQDQSPERMPIPENYEFDEWNPPRGFKKPRPAPNPFFLRNVRVETHPWLNWPNADKNEKQWLNSRLGELQNHPVNPPRIMDWGMIEQLGISGRFDRMFSTKCRSHSLDNATVYPMWQRIFNLNEKAVREWCLEFYCSLWIETDIRDSEVRKRKIIHFRAGGKQRHCTLPEFGYLTGMFTEEELPEENLAIFLREGARDTSGFDDYDDHHGFWKRISGNAKHSSKTSKISDIYDPVLRILHKLISYNFLHRSHQNDKPYQDDLWLMRLFAEGAPSRYTCAPYTLAHHMVKQKDGALCGGHFISRIFRRLGLIGGAEDRFLSVQVEMRVISWKDLSASKLLKPGTKQLIDFMQAVQVDSDEDEEDDDEDEGEKEEDEGNQRHPDVGVPGGSQHGMPGMQPGGFQEQASGQQDDSFGFQSIARALGLIQESQTTFYGAFQDHQRYVGSEFNRQRYDRERYQPYFESWAQREAASLGHELPPYTPPEVFYPPQFQGSFYYPQPPPPPPEQQPFFQPRPHDSEPGGSGAAAGAFGSFSDMFTDDEPIFGTRGGTFEGGGTPSVFVDPHDPTY